MKEKEYIRLRREIEADYHKKLDALDLIWKMSNKAAAPSAQFTLRPGSIVGRGSLLSAVRNILTHVQGDFTAKRIAGMVREGNPELHVKTASVSSVLKRLAGNLEIDVIEVGKGKRASTYRVGRALETEITRLA